MENKELVSFKGMADGVRINLSDTADIFELLAALQTQISKSKAFFGDGDCKITFGGRRLTGSEKQRLEETLQGLMPLARVSYDFENAKNVTTTDWIVAYKDKNKDIEEPQAEETPVSEEEFISVFRSNRARFYEGVLKEGMTLRSDGHLILLGTVSEGAALIAVGNIIVIGGLYGTAHAGCNGHNGSYIVAMDMHPEGLAIAKTAEEYTYSDAEITAEDTAETAKKTFFDIFKKKSDTSETVQESPKEQFSAVALLKNNKIKLDNFTIGDFTNLKNMV